MRSTLILISLFMTFSAACAELPPLRTVDYVDLPRYVGKWYAVASLPQFFTRKCVGQTADYEAINSQTVSVLNTCLKVRGKSTIKGQAVVDNAATNAELTVTFNSFFTRLFRVRGDYNVINLDPDYRYVTVGGRDRKSLWIMSRTPQMPEETLAEYIENAKAQGFPVQKLIRSKF